MKYQRIYAHDFLLILHLMQYFIHICLEIIKKSKPINGRIESKLKFEKENLKQKKEININKILRLTSKNRIRVFKIK